MQWDRDLGITKALRALFDGPAELLLAVLTQLGDVWFLFVLAGTFYAMSASAVTPIHRRRGAFVLALPIVYVVLVEAMKGVFMLPRPPGADVVPREPLLPAVFSPVFENAATATGYGFPSGHALGSTLVWGGVGLVFDSWSRRRRLAAVAVVVGLVSLSRLGLGVHYFVDVVAGATLGAIVLLALYLLSERAAEPGRVFGVAVLVGLLGVVVHGSFDGVVAFGGALGAWLGWTVIVDSEVTLSVSRHAIGASTALLAATVLGFAALYLSGPPLSVTFVASAVATALLVGVPDLGERAARWLDVS